MIRRRVLVLCEHGSEFQPWCTGHIRLLRPLTHPSVRDQIEVVSARRFDGGRYDAVIVERLWRSVITVPAVERLVAEIRRSGSPLLYALDDNLLDLEPVDETHVRVAELLASAADGLLVSTEPLRDRLAGLNPNIAVVGNALDERLLVQTGDSAAPPRRRKIVGYMGTQSHDDDLAMIAPALRAVCERRPGAVALEVLGVVKRARTLEALRGVPLRVVGPEPGEADYPLFMLWYTSRIRWDVGIAPLRPNAYTACKSDIKALDYAAVGAVGVYSRLAPYEHLRESGLGLVVDDSERAWTEALDGLIADDARRHAMRDRARAWLFRERTLERCAWRWPAALDQLLSAKARRG